VPDEVAGQQAEGDAGVCGEPLEESGDARLGSDGGRLEAPLELADVHPEGVLEILLAALVADVGAQQLPDDLRIGLPVEPVAGKDAGRSGPFDQGTVNGPPPRTIGAEQGPVDVEEEQLHRGKARRLDG